MMSLISNILCMSAKHAKSSFIAIQNTKAKKNITSRCTKIKISVFLTDIPATSSAQNLILVLTCQFM